MQFAFEAAPCFALCKSIEDIAVGDRKAIQDDSRVAGIVRCAHAPVDIFAAALEEARNVAVVIGRIFSAGIDVRRAAAETVTGSIVARVGARQYVNDDVEGCKLSL